MFKDYEYVIIGSGIAGCCVSHFLGKYSNSVLLVDKNLDILSGASDAAGAFLSPLLGYPNEFKKLITTSLKFSTNFYKSLDKNLLNNCGLYRIAKNEKEQKKFRDYEKYMDFKYEKLENGYFFHIGSHLLPSRVKKILTKRCEQLLNFEVTKIVKTNNNSWLINDKIITKNLILTTGINTKIIKEQYLQIKPVWGQKIDIKTSSTNSINYHKGCSISAVTNKSKDGKNILSLGSTHHRFENKNIDKYGNFYTQKIIHEDNKKLISLSKDILNLKDIEIIDIKVGARACSSDYFPIVGQLVDSKKNIKKYPHLINGKFIEDDKLIKINNLFILNGLGGRGFVLSPYLANELVEYIVNNKKLQSCVMPHRFFKRWVKKSKLNT